MLDYLRGVLLSHASCGVARRNARCPKCRGLSCNCSPEGQGFKAFARNHPRQPSVQCSVVCLSRKVRFPESAAHQVCPAAGFLPHGSASPATLAFADHVAVPSLNWPSMPWHNARGPCHKASASSLFSPAIDRSDTRLLLYHAVCWPLLRGQDVQDETSSTDNVRPSSVSLHDNFRNQPPCEAACCKERSRCKDRARENMSENKRRL